MKLIHRIGYYLGGFSIGLILLAFFLSGKKTSCAYGPNARTIKSISTKKQRFYSDAVESAMKTHNLDTLAITNLIKTGDVNFSESDTKSEGCKTYLIENELNDKAVELTVKNCDSAATIQSLIIK
ncbi:hypothetical protein [uncultured Psychroserpens sp.]|uniref:hypothetical protein n=1 Tax=uncultured Psychroserpens sp. TaxID=255436 RepID=UPI00260C328D|nr:hypothetical protein [uncultured Psychroserpens sp.]